MLSWRHLSNRTLFFWGGNWKSVPFLEVITYQKGWWRQRLLLESQNGICLPDLYVWSTVPSVCAPHYFLSAAQGCHGVCATVYNSLLQKLRLSEFKYLLGIIFSKSLIGTWTICPWRHSLPSYIGSQECSFSVCFLHETHF